MIHHLPTLQVLSDLGLLLSTEHGELTAIHRLNPSASPQRLFGRISNQLFHIFNLKS